MKIENSEAPKRRFTNLSRWDDWIFGDVFISWIEFTYAKPPISPTHTIQRYMMTYLCLF